MLNGGMIYKALIKLGVKNTGFNHLKEYDDFTLLISVILGQNTRWENALLAIKNLKDARVNSLSSLDEINPCLLGELIKPCGFYKQKSLRLKALVRRLLNDFLDLDNFKKEVDKTWLLECKGIGPESCDSILNYVCEKEVMIVDKYSFLLACNLGYVYEDYYELQEFYESGVCSMQEGLNKALKIELSLAKHYANFHSLIINFSKANIKKKLLDPQAKQSLKELLN